MSEENPKPCGGRLRPPLRVVLTRVGESPPYHCGGDRWLIDAPAKAFEFWQEVIAAEQTFEPDKEHLVAVLVNTKFQVTGYHVVSVGSVNESIAHPREIFRAVIVAAAFGLVLMHNHPSGDPSPSKADHVITKKIQDGADLLNLRLLDHVIAGKETFYSFKESGAVFG